MTPNEILALWDGELKYGSPAELNATHPEFIIEAIGALRELAQPLRYAFSAAVSKITADDRFQAACQRYAHANGSSDGIAAAALRALWSGAGDAGGATESPSPRAARQSPAPEIGAQPKES